MSARARSCLSRGWAGRLSGAGRLPSARPPLRWPVGSSGVGLGGGGQTRDQKLHLTVAAPREIRVQSLTSRRSELVVRRIEVRKIMPGKTAITLSVIFVLLALTAQFPPE